MDGRLPPRVERFRREIVDRIPCYPPEGIHRAQLDALSLPDLMSVYVHSAQRTVRTASRWTTYAPGFWTHRALTHQPAIRALEAKMALGEDVTPYLSRRARTDGFPARDKLARGSIDWQRMDMALNAWSVHHFHLHPGRTDELLFAIVTRAQAVFLLLGDHRSFHNGDVEAAVVGWRAATGSFELKGVLPEQRPFSPAERTALVRSGLTTTASVDGKVILSGLVSSAGTSMQAGIYADKVVVSLKAFDHLLDEGPLTRIIPGEHLLRLRGRDWSWRMHGCDLVLDEARTPMRFLALLGPN